MFRRAGLEGGERAIRHGDDSARSSVSPNDTFAMTEQALLEANVTTRSELQALSRGDRAHHGLEIAECAEVFDKPRRPDGTFELEPRVQGAFR